jgi:hypothetical protein
MHKREQREDSILDRGQGESEVSLGSEIVLPIFRVLKFDTQQRELAMAEHLLSR